MCGDPHQEQYRQDSRFAAMFIERIAPVAATTYPASVRHFCVAESEPAVLPPDRVRGSHFAAYRVQVVGMVGLQSVRSVWITTDVNLLLQYQ